MLITSVSADERSAGAWHDLAEVVRDLRASRGLIVQLTLRDLRVRYKQAIMGVAWAILAPLLLVAAGVVLRVALLRLAGQGVSADAVAAIVVKGVAWTFVAGAVTFATGALTLNAPLVSKIYFPRETLPLSVVLASCVDALVSASTLCVILPALGWRPTWAVLWVPVLALVLLALTLAAALLVSCANLFFRDVKYVVQLLVTFGVFFTPVFYDPEALGARWLPLVMANPLAPVLQGLRLAVVRGHDLLAPLTGADGAVVWTPLYLGYAAAWALVGLVVSAVIFHRAQYRFAEYV
jgi:ABC-type polysaccharide/polyol phosphate export permease